MITLPTPKSDSQEILKALIENKSLTSIDLKRHYTGSSYPPARCAELRKKGLDISSTMESYTNRRGEKSHVARYTLLTSKKEAVKVYLKMVA